MKTKILVLATLISFSGFAQDSLQISPPHGQIFSLSPISKNVDKVNGLVFGVGHVENKNIAKQTINGMNVEANPAPIVGAIYAFFVTVYLPEILKRGVLTAKKNDSLPPTHKIKNWTYTPDLKINGINLSTGCFFTTTSINGLNISLGNKFKTLNGLSIAPLGTIADVQNGVSCGLINVHNNLRGACFGIYNNDFGLNGAQLGVCNYANNNQGIQIGIYNKSYSRGLQLGIWNKNNRRQLPLINF